MVVITLIVVIAYYPISAPVLLGDGAGLGCRSARLQRAKPCLLFRPAERCTDTSLGLLLESFEVLGRRKTPLNPNLPPHGRGFEAFWFIRGSSELAPPERIAVLGGRALKISCWERAGSLTGGMGGD